MKEKIVRSIIFFGSFLLLSASAWMVSWVSQNEGTRLAMIERLNLEERSQSQLETSPATLTAEQIATETDQALSDIETLLLSIGADDVPIAE